MGWSTAAASPAALTRGKGAGMNVTLASKARPAALRSAAAASPEPSAANLRKALTMSPWFPAARGAMATADTVGLSASTAPLGTLATRSL